MAPGKAAAAAAADTAIELTSKEEAIQQRELQLQLQLRAQELAQRENELKLREAEVRNQQAKVQQALATGKVKNFPWIWPIMYHNIEEEVPTEHRRACRALFWGWKATVATLLVNMATCLAMLMAHAQGINTAASDLGGSIVYFVMISIGSLYLWYRPAYSAFIRNSGLYYYIFFLFNGIQIAFHFYMFVGIPGSGAGGVINAIAMYTDNKLPAAIMACITAFLWVTTGTYMLYWYQKVHTAYRSGGGSIDSVRAEAVRAAAVGGAM